MTTQSGALDTFPKFLVHNAQMLGSRPAMRHKDFGIWQTWTWSQMRDEIFALANGLAAMGFKRGDKIAIVGRNRPRLYWSMCAAQCLGGIPVPVYQDSVADEIQYVLDHSEVRFALVEDQEQVDKMLEAYQEARKVTDMLGRPIYNATVGGKLEVFERVNYDSLFQEGATSPLPSLNIATARPEEYPAILLLDAVRFGGATATGDLKQTLFEGWPEDRVLQVFSNGHDTFVVSGG